MEFGSIKEFLLTIYDCRNCNKKLKFTTDIDSVNWKTRASIYIENNCLYLNQKSFLGNDILIVTINKNDNRKFLIEYLDNHTEFNKNYKIIFHCKCSECDEYNCAKIIELNHKLQEITYFGFLYENFENKDFIISHDYKLNTSNIIKKEKIIELQLASRLSLNNLEFEKLFKTASLLK